MKLASDQTRKSWVIQLQRMLDPETGAIQDDAFRVEQRRYEKACALAALNDRICRCTRCCESGDIGFPCPGWGNIEARIMFVGQSLHEPGVSSRVPFILGSGLLCDAALRLIGLDRSQCFWTNAVHCHPSRNRASKASEIQNCSEYLLEEINVVHPEMLVCLGNDSKAVVTKAESEGTIPDDMLVAKLVHPAAVLRGSPESTKEFVLRLARELERI